METLKPSIYILYPQYMRMFTMLISLSTYIGEAIESLCAWTRLVAARCVAVAVTRSSGLTHHHYSGRGQGQLKQAGFVSTPSTFSFKFAMPFIQVTTFSRDIFTLTTVGAHHQQEVLRIPQHPLHTKFARFKPSKSNNDQMLYNISYMLCKKM